MSAGEFAVALVVAIAGGGYVGCVIDRWRRRPRGDEERYPRRWTESTRMDRLHVVDGDLYKDDDVP